MSEINTLSKQITLTDDYKYANVLYFNNTNEEVILLIFKLNKSVTVPAYKDINVSWTKNINNETTYTISVNNNESLAEKILIVKSNNKDRLN